nr:CatB-related O-acetyltransferase [uncultured Rhodoferax sp.]
MPVKLKTHAIGKIHHKNLINMLRKYLKILMHLYRQPKCRISFNSNISLDTKIQENVKIFEGCKISSCKIGRFTYIGKHSEFERTEIGSFTSIAPQVLCGMGSHPLSLISTYPGFYTNKSSGAEWLGTHIEFNDRLTTTIGSDVWIGIRSIIMAGVTVGDGAVIAAGSIVTKDVPPYAIVAGVPAKFIKYRFSPDKTERILKSKWWDMPINKIKNAAKFADQPDIFISNL